MIGPEELARLWREHAAALEMLARSRCAAAEDCVQQAFIRLAVQRNPISDPAAWLFRVVRNLAIDQGRRERRRRWHENEFATMYVRESDTGADQSAWDEHDLSRALLELEDEQRELVVAHLWGRLTFRQLADAFDLSSSAVHRRYAAAIVRLRQILESDQPVISAPHESDETGESG